LNAHVDNAELLPGAISAQNESSPQGNDYILAARGAALFKYTINSIRDLLSTYFPLRSGSSMTGELILSSSVPSAANVAASKGYVDSTAAAATLSGAIVMWGGSSAPTGWLECNGQAAPPSLQSIYGATLPDLRGEFVRGWSNGRDVDPGRVLGSSQGQDIQPHTHLSNSVGLVGTKTINWIGTLPSAYSNSNVTQTGSAGGTETRPRNVALMFIVKT
jgi:microcystin-dependent protein